MSYGAGKKTSPDEIHELKEHSHSIACVYPTGAAGVTVTGAEGAWTLGNFAEIVPASTITSPFDLHWIEIEGVSAADNYELVLYEGSTERGRIRFTVLGTPANTIINPRFMMTPIFAANAQVQAKLMNSGGGAETVDISIAYHTY